MHFCSICDRHFSRSDNFKRHNRALHKQNSANESQGFEQMPWNNELIPSEALDKIDESENDSNSESSDEDPNDNELSENEIKRLRQEVAWTEIGERTLSRNALRSLVRNLVLPDDDDDEEEEDEEEEDEEEERDGYRMNGEEEETFADEDEEDLSNEAVVFLREMFKAADESTFTLTRRIFYEIIENLS
jgi:hypothetical protein